MSQIRKWPVQDAKAKFSELLEEALRHGPQIVTKRGVESAVLLPVEEWRRLLSASKPSLKDLLLADEPRGDLNVPQRGARRRRRPAAALDE